MSGNAVDVRIDCVAVPGGWERSVACVCFSERARRYETRVFRERSFSELRSSHFVETVYFFGGTASRYSERGCVLRNVTFQATVYWKQ
jgi:hypothetical protein